MPELHQGKKEMAQQAVVEYRTEHNIVEIGRWADQGSACD